VTIPYCSFLQNDWQKNPLSRQSDTIWEVCFLVLVSDFIFLFFIIKIHANDCSRKMQFSEVLRYISCSISIYRLIVIHSLNWSSNIHLIVSILLSLPYWLKLAVKLPAKSMEDHYRMGFKLRSIYYLSCY